MTKKIQSFLSPMTPLIAKAKKIEQIAQKIAPILSPNPSIWRVGNYENGTLTLLTPDAAYATQLRFLCPHLTSHLRKEAILPDLAQIKIKVAPLPEKTDRKYTKKRKKNININFENEDNSGLDHFEDGKLKTLLSNLYANMKSNT